MANHYPAVAVGAGAGGVPLGLADGEGAAVVGLGLGDGAGAGAVVAGLGDGEGLAVSPAVSPVGESVPGALLPAGNVCVPP